MRRLLILLALLPLGACASGLVNDNDLALGPDASEGLACAVRSMPELGGPPPVTGYGCATEVNLRAMLADPADLDEPVAHGAPGGDPAIEAVRRLRTGQPRPLPSSTAPRAPVISIGGPGGDK